MTWRTTGRSRVKEYTIEVSRIAGSSRVKKYTIDLDENLQVKVVKYTFVGYKLCEHNAKLKLKVHTASCLESGHVVTTQVKSTRVEVIRGVLAVR